MKRISYEEVKELVGESWQAFPWSVFSKIMDAQLASCEAEAQAEKEAMVKELESLVLPTNTLSYFCVPREWWQAFKQKWLNRS